MVGLQHKILPLVFLFGMIVFPQVFAAPSLKINPPAERIAADQNANLTLRLEWPAAEDPYEIHSLEPKYENLTLVDQRQSQSISISEDTKLGQPWLPSWERKSKPGQSQETGPVISQTITYVFRPLKKGTALIYPFEISYRKSEADPWSSLLVPEQKIKVVASFPLRPIFTGILFLFGASAACFAAFKIRWLAKSRRDALNAPPPDPRQKIYANAEEALATFASLDAKVKLIHWSQQLRTVVSTYYDIPSKAPSAEIVSFLKTRGLPAGEWNEVSRLFEQLTEMQFSRQDIPSCDLDRMQKTLLQYVKGKIIIGNSSF